MPTLPWQNQGTQTHGTPGPGESCSLVGQHTLEGDPYIDETGSQPIGSLPPPEYVGAVLVYKYQDINGDGFIDLITAVERDPNYYAPEGFLATCPVPEAATLQGPQNTFGEIGPEDPPPPGGWPATANITSLVPYEPCPNVYPWNVHLGDGAGAFADTSFWPYASTTASVQVNAPIPLGRQVGEKLPLEESTSTNATEHTFRDMDGDGFPDFVRVYRENSTAPWKMEVSLWDAESQDPVPTAIPWAEEADFTIRPMYPARSSQEGSGSSLENFEFTTLMDINGDGLADYLDKNPPATNAHYYQNAGAPTATSPALIDIEPLSGFSHPSITDLNKLGGIWERTQREAFRDIDGDGRPDRISSAGIYFSMGEGYTLGGTGVSMGQEATIEPDEWLITRDWVDLTGDGIVDLVYRTGASYETLQMSRQNAQGERRGVLKSIDNGRGLVVDVAYTPHTDDSVVTMGTGKLPSTTWVVKSITATHSHGSPVPAPATTSYAYDTPVWSQDPDGRWGFRGFETVTTTGPSGARTEERYAYWPDWSGRLSSTLTYQDGSNDPATISDTVWDLLQLPLNSEKNVDFFFPVAETSYRCEYLDNGATAIYDETTCRAQATSRRKMVGYATLEDGGGNAIAFAKDREISGEWDGALTVTGLLSTSTHDSLYTASAYRIVSKLVVEGEGSATWQSSCFSNNSPPCIESWSPTIDTFSGYSESFWNSDLTLVEKSCSARSPDDLQPGGVDPSSSACTAYTYDPDTGLKLTEQRPEMFRLENYPEPGETPVHLVTTFDYSGASFPTNGMWPFPEASFEVVPVSVTNELGHTVHAHTDLGTGAVLATYGPNPNEGSYQILDGFGRALETWISTDEAGPGDPYLWLRTGINEYQDLASPQQRIERSSRNPKDASWYTTKYNDTYWAEHRTVYDGAGRVIESIDWDISASEPDTTRRFVYDAAGNLDFATVPDPTTSNDDVRVTYDFSYDSLGRRTCATTPDGTGVATIFGGDTTVVMELVPDGGGGGTCANPATTANEPHATRTITKDVHDRVETVTEATSGTDALTTYVYDAGGNVARITREDDTEAGGDIVTEMTHDWVGNRLTITRDPTGTNRTWTYEYDLDGNLESQTSPGGSPDHTTTYVYDELGRMESKMAYEGDLASFPGSLNVAELAVGSTQFTYDEGLNGLGRLTSTTLPFGSVSMVYDAWGNLTDETRTIDLSSALGVTFADTLTRHAESFTSDGKPMKVVEASNITTIPIYAYWGWRPFSVKAYHNETGFGSSYVTIFTNSYNAAGLIKSRKHQLRDDASPYATHGGRIVYFNRDQNGRVIQEYATDSSSSDDKIVQDYTFYGAGEVATLESRVGASSDERNYTFIYDNQHQLTNAFDDKGYSGDFTYSRQGRLKTADIEATPGPNTLVHPRNVDYVYKDVSETPTGTPTPDPEAVSRLNIAGTTSEFANFAHDVNGNMTWRKLGTDEWHLGYGGEDRMRVRQTPSGDQELYYYHDNARWLAVKKDSVGNVLSARLWFGNAEIQYTCAAGTCSRSKKRTTLRLGGEAVARFEKDVATGAQTERLLHSNRLGHLLGVYRYQDATGALDYNLEVGYQYGPFGEVLEVKEFPGATTTATDYTERFNGKELDEASGLSYYGYRYYDPLSLTWNRADPLYRFSPDMELTSPRMAGLYSFSTNNPVRFVDPDGLEGKDSTLVVYGADYRTQVRYHTRGSSAPEKKRNYERMLLSAARKALPRNKRKADFRAQRIRGSSDVKTAREGRNDSTLVYVGHADITGKPILLPNMGERPGGVVPADSTFLTVTPGSEFGEAAQGADEIYILGCETVSNGAAQAIADTSGATVYAAVGKVQIEAHFDKKTGELTGIGLAAPNGFKRIEPSKKKKEIQ